MPIYRVVWEIDIDADNPQHAAEQALAIQQKVDSIAHVFDVYVADKLAAKVDLDYPLESEFYGAADV